MASEIFSFRDPLHGLRHARPLGEAFAGSRTLEQIRRRGRWSSLKSGQRYTKAHALAARLARPPPDVQQQGARFLHAPGLELREASRLAPAATDKVPARRALLAALEQLAPGPYRPEQEDGRIPDADKEVSDGSQQRALLNKHLEESGALDAPVGGTEEASLTADQHRGASVAPSRQLAGEGPSLRRAPVPARARGARRAAFVFTFLRFLHAALGSSYTTVSSDERAGATFAH